jgi:hypothetical protein
VPCANCKAKTTEISPSKTQTEIPKIYSNLPFILYTKTLKTQPLKSPNLKLISNPFLKLLKNSTNLFYPTNIFNG